MSDNIKYLESVRDEIGKHHDEGWAWCAEVIDNAIQELKGITPPQTFSPRTFSSLTDEEIQSAMRHIFSPIQIGDITRTDEQHISIELFMMPEHPDMSDTIELTETDMTTNDFDCTAESVLWQQFLLSKGIHPLLIDNPFLAHTDTAAAIYHSLDNSTKRELYTLFRKEYVQEDVRNFMQSIEKPLTEDRIENVVNAYVCDCKYDCTLSYWDNLEALIVAEYRAQLEDAKARLEAQKGNFDLTDVELTDEDVQTVITYISEDNFSMDAAISTTLSGIEETLAEQEAEETLD